MVNTSISGLNVGGAYASTDEQPVVETTGVGPVKKTGTQLAEYIRDIIGSANVGGTGITFTPNDGADTLTFALTNMAEATIKGRASGAGTGTPTDLTPAEVRTIIDTITSGAGAPSTTPSFVGQLYVDTTNDKLWGAAGTASSADWKMIGPGPEVLTADRTYYVNETLGSDSNDGLSAGAGAFATIQKALDVIGELNRSIYDVTIDVTGTFDVTDGGDGALVVKFGPGSGEIRLSGQGTGVTSITQTNNGDFDRGLITVKGNGTCVFFAVDNIELIADTGTTGVRLLYAGLGGRLKFGNVKFSGDDANGHIRADVNGYIEADGAYEIAGDANRHFDANGGTIRVVNSGTITLTGTPDFSNEFVRASVDGTALCNVTFSGSATGDRYLVERCSIINSFGGGTSYFPGNAAGTETTSTSGHYLP